MNPMSLLTLPPRMLHEGYHQLPHDHSHGESNERLLALAVGLVSFCAAAVLVFA